MSAFFRIERGLEIDDAVKIIQGSGAPGSTTDTDDALIGSTYHNVAAGTVWQKIQNGSETEY